METGPYEVDRWSREIKDKGDIVHAGRSQVERRRRKMVVELGEKVHVAVRWS